MRTQTDPAACASPEAATHPSLAAPTAAGAQTARPVVTVESREATIAYAGHVWTVDLRDHRDDWTIPEELTDAQALAALDALDEADLADRDDARAA